MLSLLQLMFFHHRMETVPTASFYGNIRGCNTAYQYFDVRVSSTKHRTSVTCKSETELRDLCGIAERLHVRCRLRVLAYGVRDRFLSCGEPAAIRLCTVDHAVETASYAAAVAVAVAVDWGAVLPALGDAAFDVGEAGGVQVDVHGSASVAVAAGAVAGAAALVLVVCFCSWPSLATISFQKAC